MESVCPRDLYLHKVMMFYKTSCDTVWIPECVCVHRFREPDQGAVQASAGGVGRHPAGVEVHV